MLFAGSQERERCRGPYPCAVAHVDVEPGQEWLDEFIEGRSMLTHHEFDRGCDPADLDWAQRALDGEAASSKPPTLEGRASSSSHGFCS